ncbi:LCP family protein required for cell wall assembly [Catenibacillus scindens]|uniref:LCP family protein required for cell wall assembly n=1 Tax=Catenibacillus scindens TaxID=673271 RepID=A0A7W8M6G9_9FIRM|nr:LCP family protein required for cell wall assembly [Catenibacillus scindens]
MKKGENDKKKGLPVWALVILCVAAALLVTIAAGYGYIQSKLGKINRTQDQTALSPEEEYFETGETLEESLDTISQEDVEWDSDAYTFSREDVTNILLIGQDSSDEEERTRSDSMIIVSVNKKKGKVALTSLMRDMYVQIPGYSDNRLNAAYAFGGMELLDETIEKNFAIDIDGNIEVNFDGFEAVIDAVGGVDIELNSAEVSHLNKKHSTWHLKVGMNHLDGEKALEYARIRKVGDGDFERTDRQRRVLTAVFDEMKNISITRLIALADELFPLLTTDMDNGEIIRLGINVLSMDLDTLETYRIPCDDAYDEVRVFARDGTAMDVLIPDLDLNRSYFYQNIYINP